MYETRPIAYTSALGAQGREALRANLGCDLNPLRARRLRSSSRETNSARRLRQGPRVPVKGQVLGVFDKSAGVSYSTGFVLHKKRKMRVAWLEHGRYG